MQSKNKAKQSRSAVPNGIEHSFSSGDIKYVPLKERFKGQLG